MFLLVLLALFVGLPIAEIYVILQVGEAIGVLPTIALLIADAVLGTWLVRSQGRAAWRRFVEALSSGRPPAREVLDGALVLMGGAAMIAPGFITDIFGVLILAPPTRALLRRLLVRRLTRSLVIRASGRWRGRPGAARHHDIEGTATDVDQAKLPR